MNKEQFRIRDEKILQLWQQGVLLQTDIAARFNVSVQTVSAIVNKRGIKVNYSRIRKEIKKKKYFIESEKLAQQLGRIPRFTEMQPIVMNSYPFFKMCRTHLLKKGFKQYNFKYTHDELLNNLRQLAKQLGRTPCIRDIDKFGKMNHATYYNIFGSLTKAQQLAGLVPNTHGGQPVCKLTNKELLAHLKALGKELARTPSMKDIDRAGKVRAVVFVYRFRSIGKALQLAGLIPNKRGMK